MVGRANFTTYIKAAKEAGFDCIEPTKTQINYFLDAGNSTEDVKRLLGDLKISSVGWLSDIERQGYDFVSMMKEAEKLFETASLIGSEAVEVINGPVDWHAVDAYRRGIAYEGYMGLQGLPNAEQEKLTVKNLKALANLAKQYGLTLFFEPLCWTPIPSLKEGIPIVEEVGADNLKVVIDFYHNYIAGLSPDFISKIDKNIVLGTHICNSRTRDNNVPCEEIYRDVAFYDGAINVAEWTQAVKATGFDGWWAYETFSKKEIEEEVYDFAKYVHTQMKKLVFS